MLKLVLLTVLSLQSVLFALTSDWEGAEKIFLVENFHSSDKKAGRDLADTVQIRLRKELGRTDLSAYVFAWVEMEAGSPAKTIKLKGNQTLYIVQGKLAGTVAKITVIRKTSTSVDKLKEKLFRASGERWKPVLSRKIVDYIFFDVLKMKRISTPHLSRKIQWGESIVANGDFERGRGFKPACWNQVDGLCSYWIKSNGSRQNRCIRFDTNVSQNQAWDWWRAIKNGADPRNAPTPIPTNPPHYNAVGGVEGVKLYSDFIPIVQGKTYLLSARLRGPAGGNAKLFVKGYAMLPTAKSDTLKKREAWRTYMQCNTNGKAWKTYTQTFTIPKNLPSVRKRISRDEVKLYQPKIKWIRVMLYAYWVVGNYYFDDVSIKPAVKSTLHKNPDNNIQRGSHPDHPAKNSYPQ